MSLLKSVGAIILSYFTCLVITDIAGVVLVAVLPGPASVTFSGHSGYGSVALYYVVWIVAGCFAGAFFASSNVEKMKGDRNRKKGLLFTIAFLLSAGLILLFYSVGEMTVSDLDYSSNYYVPGNRYLTYTFFITFLLVTILLLKNGKTKLEKSNADKEP